jgi:hypothetical protein
MFTTNEILHKGGAAPDMSCGGADQVNTLSGFEVHTYVQEKDETVIWWRRKRAIGVCNGQVQLS